MATEDLTPDPRDLQCVNIISSHKIGAKTTRCLSILFPESTATTTAAATPTPTAANTVCIRAKAAVAGKAISIAEIVKRRMEERQETWYQYTALSTGETPEKQKKKKPLGGAGAGVEGGDDEEDPFVPLPEKETARKVKTAVISIYISRAPLPGYRKLYG